MLFLRGNCGSVFCNSWPICQTKCLSICVCYQIAKLNEEFVIQVASNTSCHVFNKFVKREIVKIVDEEKVS